MRFVDLSHTFVDLRFGAGLFSDGLSGSVWVELVSAGDGGLVDPISGDGFTEDVEGGLVVFSDLPCSESCSAGRTRTCNLWINSPARPVRPVQVGDVWCRPVHEFQSVVLSGDALSRSVRLHKWLHVATGTPQPRTAPESPRGAQREESLQSSSRLKVTTNRLPFISC
jgi:hypothetical protein